MTHISVIVPCYNASAYLQEAIESVLSQSYKDWELIIVDDGSTDDSRDIAKEYVMRDKRIFLIEQPNSGACRARNNGIEHAKGEYIKFLDADDILEPDCLATQVKQIKELSPRQIPFGDYYNVDKDGNVISEYEFNNLDELLNDSVYFFFNEWHILISSPLHRKSLLQEIGGFDETLKRGQESDMHLRLALSDVEFIYNPCMTFRYRDHRGETRISENFKEGSIERALASYQQAHIYEKLLIRKYGTVPMKYHSYLSHIWFSYARHLFAEGNKEAGITYLQKSQEYGILDNFQKYYVKLGKRVGYIPLEYLFQLRLKMLHKK